MSTNQNILLEKKDGVACIWLNRPDRHNALNPEMMKELVAVLQELEADESVRLLVLRGKGPSFCAGADIAWMKEAALQSEEQNRVESRLLAEVFFRIHRFPMPTVSVVHGNVIGGGMGLMAATDYTLACPDTKFKLSEVRLGLLPATIFPYLLQRSSAFRIKELTLTASFINANQAYDYQLINRIVGENLEEDVEALVKNLKEGAPFAQREAKELIHYLSGKPIIQETVEKTIASIAKRRLHEEGQEGMAAFLEKRKPAWADEFNSLG